MYVRNLPTVLTMKVLTIMRVFLDGRERGEGEEGKGRGCENVSQEYSAHIFLLHLPSFCSLPHFIEIGCIPVNGGSIGADATSLIIAITLYCICSLFSVSVYCQSICVSMYVCM